jgi:hypothetical protein
VAVASRVDLGQDVEGPGLVRALPALPAEPQRLVAPAARLVEAAAEQVGVGEVADPLGVADEVADRDGALQRAGEDGAALVGPAGERQHVAAQRDRPRDGDAPRGDHLDRRVELPRRLGQTLLHHVHVGQRRVRQRERERHVGRSGERRGFRPQPLGLGEVAQLGQAEGGHAARVDGRR